MELKEPSAKYLVEAEYKQTEIGLLPVEWQVRKLGELVDIKDGTHQTPRYVSMGIPFYSVEHVTSNDFENTKFISEHEHLVLSRSSKIEKGDVLMTRIGSIGDCKLIDWDVKASYYVSLALLKFRKEYSPLFFVQYSRSSAFKNEAEIHSLQAAIPKKINLGPISDIRVPAPSLTEQWEIANLLTDADALIESLEQLLAKKRQIKQGAMQELLTGQRRLPGFSENWKSELIDSIADVKTGPFGSSLHESDYVDDGTPIVTVEHLGEFGLTRQNLPMVSVSDRQRLRAYELEAGDIVFSRVGSVDRNALVRPDEAGWLFSGRLLRVRPSRSRVVPEFLSYQFHSEPFKASVLSVAVGQTMASLNTSILKSLVVALPALDEQTAIATVLSDMDTEITALEARLTKARQLKQGMAQALLTGRIRLV